MPYVKKKRPYKKEYQQQKKRGEHKDRMERQRARRAVDKKGVDKNQKGVRIKMATQFKARRKIDHSNVPKLEQ